MTLTHGENSSEEIQPFSTKSWENQTGDTFVADIEELNIDEALSKYVRQGGIVRWTPDNPVRTLMSEGFSRCTAVITHDPETGGFDFAHAQPLDNDLYYKMRDMDFGQSLEAFFVFGKHSTHQYDINELLSSRGAKITQVHLDTGGAHFAVSLDTQSGVVSVVRKTPDHTIFQYHPFTRV